MGRVLFSAVQQQMGSSQLVLAYVTAEVASWLVRAISNCPDDGWVGGGSRERELMVYSHSFQLACDKTNFDLMLHFLVHH